MENIIIGKTQTLTVKRAVDFGIYLGTENSEETVLLPKKQVPSDTKIGDRLSVFVYRDSEDRPIATVNKPAAEAGMFAYLPVTGITKVGAFLSWGLEKDLFLPFKEQEGTVSKGDNVPVFIYLDKSERLAATMKLYDHLSPADENVREEDAFAGYVYRVQREIGAFTAVIPAAYDGTDSLYPAYDKLYFGLIPKSQVFKNYRSGEKVSGRIVRVRNDRKLDLSVRARDYAQLDADGEKILAKIDEYGGTLPFSEKASPEIIKRELEMSKNGFKKALGHLLKAGKIEIGETEVRKITS